MTSLSHVPPRARPRWWSVAALLFAGAGSLVAADLSPSLRATLEEHCLSCHDDVEAKAGLDLSALKFEPSDAASFEAWVKVHDRVRDGEMPPKKKARPPAAETQALLAFLDRQLHAASAAAQRQDGRARARRLNRDEYQATLRDLLGVHRDYRALLPEDGRALGFDKVAGALSVSAEHLEAYLAAAGAALSDAFAPAPAAVKRRIPQRFEDLERLQRIFSHQFLPQPDALVFFGDQWDNITGFTARQPGRYRFTVRARAFQSTGPVKARLRAGADAEVSRRLLTYTEFPPEGAEFQLETWLEPRETLHLSPIGTAPRSRNPSTHRPPLKREYPASQYKGPGLALEWVEVEGPLPDDRFHATILVGVELAAGTRNEAATVLARFLPRAFRRPVTPAETAHFLKIFDAEASERGFAAGLKGALQAVLCSPHFIYLHGPPGALDDYSLASRLSYFFWNAMPDDTLLALAASGELRQPARLRQQVERMLEDPRATAFSESFTGQWLDLRQIDATTPDPELYPEFDELLAWSSVRETRLFFDEVLRRDLSLLNFVQSDFTLLNDRLALHYGIPGVSGIAFRKTALPADSARGGLLTQASVLKVTANGTTSSPILRGAWVMDRILGKAPPPPPPGTPGLEPDIRGATTIREQLEKHRADSSCAACHARIDPPGFALESFDVIGGWRERYRASREGARETMEVALPLRLELNRGGPAGTPPTHPRSPVGLGPAVDPSSEFNGHAFRDVAEFRRLLLADGDQLTRALIARLTTYATGTGLQYADRVAIEELVRRVKARHHGLRSTLHEIVQSPLFLNR